MPADREAPSGRGLLERTLAAILPVDILADPDSPLGGAVIETRIEDAVRPERVRDGATVVAGWADRAWRSRASISGSVVTLRPPRPAQPEPNLKQWLEGAHRVMAETLPNAVDASTREVIARQILAPPMRYIEAQSRALALLLGAHQTLRWCARRVLLQTVAAQHLGTEVPPHMSAPWHLLARLTRTPATRLAGRTTRGVLIHDASPRCPTARQWLNL